MVKLSKVTEAVPLRTYIRMMPGSKLGRTTNYPDPRFREVREANTWQYLKLDSIASCHIRSHSIFNFMFPN